MTDHRKATQDNKNRGDANPSRSGGRYAYDGLDRVLHEKARLGILASLVAHSGGLLFADLKELCALTDGNLSRHLGVLSDAGFVEVWKSQSGRKQTLYKLTVEGRKRFSDYIGELERVVADAQRSTRDGRQTAGGSRSLFGLGPA